MFIQKERIIRRLHAFLLFGSLRGTFHDVGVGMRVGAGYLATLS